MATVDDVKAAYLAINRVELNDTAATATASAIDGGQITLTQYRDSLVTQSATTTQAALALSVLVTGLVPTSEKLDSLTAFAKTQLDYYTNVLQSGSPQLGAFEALGKAYATDADTSAAFAAKFGALSAADFVTAAFATAFDIAPTAAGAANLVAQVEYFTKLYTDAGIPAADAALQAKGAVYGQIIGYAVTDPEFAGNTTLDTVFGNLLKTLADDAVAGDESTEYGKPLPGVGGVTINVNAGDSVALDAVPGFKSTVFGDTVLGTISDAGAAVSINTAAGDDSIGLEDDFVSIDDNGDGITIDGSAGENVLYAKIINNAMSSDVTIKNIQKIFIDGNNLTADAENWTGYTEINVLKSTGSTEVSNILDGTKLSVDSTTQNVTFEMADDVTSATVTVKNFAGELTVDGDADFETINLVIDSESELAALNSVNATSVVATGAAKLTIGELAGTVESFDAAAYTGDIKLGSVTALNFGQDATVKTGTGNDTVSVDLTLAFNVDVATGNGDDNVAIDSAAFSNVTLDVDTLKTFATLSDFKAGDDKVTVTGGTYVAALSVVGQASIEDALGVVSGGLNAGEYTVFNFGLDSYIFQEDGNAGLTVGDGLIKITGVTGLTYDAGVIS